MTRAQTTARKRWLVGGDSGAHVTVPFVGKEAEASQAEDESTEAETD